MTFWHVAYFYKKDKTFFPSSAEIVLADSHTFVPSEVQEHIAHNLHSLFREDITIINWKELKKNELSQSVYDKVKDL